MGNGPKKKGRNMNMTMKFNLRYEFFSVNIYSEHLDLIWDNLKNKKNGSTYFVLSKQRHMFTTKNTIT